MRVTFKQPYRCRLGHDHKPGDTCDLPDHVAAKVLDRGIAEAVREAPVERAVVAPPENAAKRTSKPAPRGAPRKRRFSPEKE